MLANEIQRRQNEGGSRPMLTVWGRYGAERTEGISGVEGWGGRIGGRRSALALTKGEGGNRKGIVE